MIDEGTAIDKNVAIVYSPLNGTGLKPVLRTLAGEWLYKYYRREGTGAST